LIGANDACAADPGSMTSVAAFRANVDQALARLRKGLPKSRVLVASIPDLYREGRRRPPPPGAGPYRRLRRAAAQVLQGLRKTLPLGQRQRAQRPLQP